MATSAQEAEAPTPKEVFVISPIGEADSPERKNADRFLNNIVRRALPDPEYVILRADEEVSPYAITEAMLRRLLDSHFCVADITGLNPNVMYELALAHAAGKMVVTMTRDKGRPPFDIKDMRVITYGFDWEEVEAAVVTLGRMAEHEPEDSRFRDMFNPVTTAFRDLMDRQKAESELGTPAEAFARMVENIERKLDVVIRGQSEDSGSRVGTPTITQTYPDEGVVLRMENLMDLFARRVLESNVGPKSFLRYRGHMKLGEALIQDLVEGRGNLASLEKWAHETELLIAAKNALDNREAELP
ncbi:hypothetical protein VUN82_06650 [Micrococcaceae bacterium Sec5.1]